MIALLKSEKTYIPALVLEYVMYELIRYGIEQCEACNTSTTIKMQQEDREYVFNILKQDAWNRHKEIDYLSAWNSYILS